MSGVPRAGSAEDRIGPSGPKHGKTFKGMRTDSILVVS